MIDSDIEFYIAHVSYIAFDYSHNVCIFVDFTETLLVLILGVLFNIIIIIVCIMKLVNLGPGNTGTMPNLSRQLDNNYISRSPRLNTRTYSGHVMLQT